MWCRQVSAVPAGNSSRDISGTAPPHTTDKKNSRDKGVSGDVFPSYTLLPTSIAFGLRRKRPSQIHRSLRPVSLPEKIHFCQPRTEDRPSHREDPQMPFPVLFHRQDHHKPDHRHTRTHCIHTFSLLPPVRLSVCFFSKCRFKPCAIEDDMHSDADGDKHPRRSMCRCKNRIRNKFMKHTPCSLNSEQDEYDRIDNF